MEIVGGEFSLPIRFFFAHTHTFFFSIFGMHIALRECLLLSIVICNTLQFPVSFSISSFRIIIFPIVFSFRFRFFQFSMYYLYQSFFSLIRRMKIWLRATSEWYIFNASIRLKLHHWQHRLKDFTIDNEVVRFFSREVR